MEITSQFITFVLIFVRISTFFVMIPILSMRQIPTTAKLGVVLMMAYVSYYPLSQQVVLDVDLLGLGIWVIREGLIGGLLGICCQFIYLGIQGAGDFVDSFVGVKMASIFDPISGTSSSLYSNLYNWLALVLFFLMQGHHYLIKGIINSFYYVPMAQDQGFQIQLTHLVDVVTKSFLISIQLALPLSVIVFMMDVILAMVSKVAPEINVFILGMPLKVVLSFVFFLLLVSGITQSISYALDSVVSILDQMMKLMF